MKSIMPPKPYTVERGKEYAWYIINNRATVRAAAVHFHVHSSAVSRGIKALKDIYPTVYNMAQAVFIEHLSTRHIKGGAATARKYKE